MRILLDTNILVHNINREDDQHEAIAKRLRGLVEDGSELCIVPQNLYELWVVATRPVSVNGLGLTPATVRRCIEQVREAFSLLPDSADVFHRWLDLCEQHNVCGRQAHDARLVAHMLCHGLKRLFILNPGDFERFGEIECIGLQ